MSYGPAPSLVGTLFTNANNTPTFHDPSLGSNTCDCGSGGDSGGGGGCTDSCSCASPPAFNDPTPPGGGTGPILPQPIFDDPTPPGRGTGPILYLGQIRPDLVGGNYPPCFSGILLLGLDPTAPSCQAAPPPGTPPGCVSLATRLALFPAGCKVAGEVAVGDLLLTRHPDGTPAGERVTDLRTSTQPCVLLETEDGRQLHGSLSHEIMVADALHPQGKRTVVAELTLSDRLLTEDGTPVALTAMTRQPDALVVQISLAGPHHLYLSDGLWSHNKITPTGPRLPKAKRPAPTLWKPPALPEAGKIRRTLCERQRDDRDGGDTARRACSLGGLRYRERCERQKRRRTAGTLLRRRERPSGLNRL